MSETVDWPVSIDGHDFDPIPESWIQAGDDHGTGSPRVYAVSAAVLARGRLFVRYVHPTDHHIVRVSMEHDPNPSGSGRVPSLLVKGGGSWPRSLVPVPDVEPSDVARSPEVAHLRELWGERVEEIPESEPAPELVTDGGRRCESLTSELSRVSPHSTEVIDGEPAGDGSSSS